MFIRFESPTINRHGIYPGVFALINGLANQGALSRTDYARWRETNDWFNATYPDPSHHDATVYDRHLNPGAVSWFKASATHLIDRTNAYVEILAAYSIECVQRSTNHPGLIIYEDDVQVVAVPQMQKDAFWTDSPG